MLAAHRDQENLVQSHQVPTKQPPKTPGARYLKTPLKTTRHDENAQGPFIGKSGIGATSKGVGTRQALMTPMDNRVRAPLGNKTTNVKAQTGQTGGVKGIVRDIEKTHVKPTTNQTKSAKPMKLAPPTSITATTQTPSSDPEEPEYAPPQPQPLPYQSDVLPDGGLTFEGLKQGNILKGYYTSFHNPVNDDGVSRKDKEFSKEMTGVLNKAVEVNERCTETLDWNPEDAPEAARSSDKKPKMERTPAFSPHSTDQNLGRPHSAILSSKKAASALAIPPENKRNAPNKPLAAKPLTRKPLGLAHRQTTTGSASLTRAQSNRTSPGEAASRTTIGYHKGRSTSSIVHQRGRSYLHQPGPKAAKEFLSGETDGGLTVTPARMRQTRLDQVQPAPRQPSLQFLSIFDDNDDHGDLPPFQGPGDFSDDEQEEFELKLGL